MDATGKRKRRDRVENQINYVKKRRDNRERAENKRKTSVTHKLL